MMASVAIYADDGNAGAFLVYPISAIFISLAVLLVAYAFGRHARGLLLLDIVAGTIAVGITALRLRPDVFAGDRAQALGWLGMTAAILLGTTLVAHDVWRSRRPTDAGAGGVS